MRGGFIMTSAVLSFNASFVYTFHKLFGFPASENLSLYLRLEILYSLAKEQKILSEGMTLPDFIKKYFGVFFPISCKIIEQFFEEYGDYGYCVAALQEMNLTKYYHETMMSNTLGKGLVILANGVLFNNTVPGIGYVIHDSNIEKYRNKLSESDEEALVNSFGKTIYSSDDVKVQDPNDETKTIITQEHQDKYYDVYRNFNVRKVAIRDIGTHPAYATASYFGSDAPVCAETNGLYVRGTLPDGGRPMALIVREEGHKKYTFHFNCHIPNPSALKKYPFNKSILENYLGDKSTDPRRVSNLDMNQWAEITLAVMNEHGTNLLKDFFTDEDLKVIFTNPDNYKILISGDFNDGTSKLLDLIKCRGGLKFGGVTVPVNFPDSPDSDFTCCANLNSEITSEEYWTTNTPTALQLTKLTPDSYSDKYIKDILAPQTDADIQKKMSVVDPKNYAFKGDTTGSTDTLYFQVYKPAIAKEILIEGKPLDISSFEKFLQSSDHMPALCLSERTQKRRRDGMDDMRDYKNARTGDNVPDVPMGDGDLRGGYKKKNKSQRKSKRYTKKRKYKKSKRR
jgi:hypothetical protein